MMSREQRIDCVTRVLFENYPGLTEQYARRLAAWCVDALDEAAQQ